MSTFELYSLKLQDILYGVFLSTMGTSDGEGLSQLYLELVNAYEKRFMPQNGQGALLMCSPIWKKMTKSFKGYLHFKTIFCLKVALGI